MSHFEFAFRHALAARRLSSGITTVLYWQLVQYTPMVTADDPWRLGIVLADRELLRGEREGADAVESLDIAIAWLLLAAHSGDEDDIVAELASERLAELIERRSNEARPQDIPMQAIRHAVEWWRAGASGAAIDPAIPLSLAVA